jgi:hypothetical protein
MMLLFNGNSSEDLFVCELTIEDHGMHAQGLLFAPATSARKTVQCSKPCHTVFIVLSYMPNISNITYLSDVFFMLCTYDMVIWRETFQMSSLNVTWSCLAQFSD